MSGNWLGELLFDPGKSARISQLVFNEVVRVGKLSQEPPKVERIMSVVKVIDSPDPAEGTCLKRMVVFSFGMERIYLEMLYAPISDAVGPLQAHNWSGRYTWFKYDDHPKVHPVMIIMAGRFSTHGVTVEQVYFQSRR